MDDYLDQLWGPSFTPQEADLYKAVQQQLIDNILSGAIKTYAWPMLVPDMRPTIETIETDSSVILLADFQKWVKKNNPAARADWLDLIMDATQPTGDPVQPDSPGMPVVQVRTKKPRGPVPNATKSAAYLEGGERLVAVAQELVDSGQKLTAETLGKALEKKYRGTKASIWKRDYVAEATMASIKSQTTHD
ncbi:hypothetical protein [Acidithiobacillus ferridurans]|uniref:hypothetical protein n=1 Tax=Acidithiobacillus ferridurans TaxID=1232575 RepID=UPI001C07D38F|nr:hypothetical protein [Acidithiobacillus ferridurans]